MVEVRWVSWGRVWFLPGSGSGSFCDWQLLYRAEQGCCYRRQILALRLIFKEKGFLNVNNVQPCFCD